MGPVETTLVVFAFVAFLRAFWYTTTEETDPHEQKFPFGYFVVLAFLAFLRAFWYTVTHPEE